MKKWENDQEAMKSMQIRVGFNNKVRPIVVRVPGRVLLQEAEVMVIEKRRKKKVRDVVHVCPCVCVCVCVCHLLCFAVFWPHSVSLHVH